MHGKTLYEYAIIRIVPKVERGECINVGVILLAKNKNYLAMKYHLDEDRLRAFSEDFDLELVNEYLKAWERVCDGGSKGGKIGELVVHERFRWLTAARSTIIQSSAVHSGLCDDPTAALDELYEKLVK